MLSCVLVCLRCSASTMESCCSYVFTNCWALACNVHITCGYQGMFRTAGPTPALTTFPTASRMSGYVSYGLSGRGQALQAASECIFPQHPSDAVGSYLFVHDINSWCNGRMMLINNSCTNLSRVIVPCIGHDWMNGNR